MITTSYSPVRCRGCGERTMQRSYGRSVSDEGTDGERKSFFSSDRVRLDIAICDRCGLVEWLPCEWTPPKNLRAGDRRCLYCDGAKLKDIGFFGDAGAPGSRLTLDIHNGQPTGSLRLSACTKCGIIQMSTESYAALAASGSSQVRHFTSADEEPSRALVRCGGCAEEDLLRIDTLYQMPGLQPLKIRSWRDVGGSPLSLYVCGGCGLASWYTRATDPVDPSRDVALRPHAPVDDCTRCGARSLWRLRAARDRISPKKSRARAVSFSLAWLLSRREGHFNLDVCASCGFVQWQARDFKARGTRRRHRAKMRSMWLGAPCRRCEGVSVALPIQRDEGGRGGIPAAGGRLQPIVCVGCGFCEWQLIARKDKAADFALDDGAVRFRKPWPKCPACDHSAARVVALVFENPKLEMNIQPGRGAFSLIHCDECGFVDWYGERLDELVADEDCVRAGDVVPPSSGGPYR